MECFEENRKMVRYLGIRLHGVRMTVLVQFIRHAVIMTQNAESRPDECVAAVHTHIVPSYNIRVVHDNNFTRVCVCARPRRPYDNNIYCAHRLCGRTYTHARGEEY